MDPASLEAQLRAREQRIERLAARWIDGPRGDAYRWLLAAWTLAVVARFTLGEAMQPSWWAPNGILLLGTVLLWWRGGRVGWALCAVGLAWPLYGLGDWLTQTVIMLLIALAGAATASAEAGDRGARVRQAARWLVVATYLIAVFHKLNTGFFDPAASCAIDGWQQLDSWFRSVELPGGGPVARAMPYLVLGSELTIAVLLALRPRIALPVAALFHLPLTLVLAPAFAFVMGIGLVAGLDARGRSALVWAWTEERKLALTATLAAISAVCVLMGRMPFPALFVKTAILCAAAVIGAIALRAPTAEGEADGSVSLAWTTVAALAVFLLNATTPYLGTQTQHTGAMLSNLRIDEGCWNHLIIPERIRGADPYIRVDRASLGNDAEGTVGRFAEYEEILLEQLWSPRALGVMRENWCTPRTRPIRIEGTWRGESLVIADLCDADADLPRPRGVWGGPALAPGYLRFQKNLMRRCDAACVH